MKNPFLQSKCSQIAGFEMAINSTGKAMPVKREGSYPLWKLQSDFKSPLRIVEYIITPDNKWKWLCKWYKIEFRYDMREDWAKVYMDIEAFVVTIAMMPAGILDVVFIHDNGLLPQMLGKIKGLPPDQIIRIEKLNPELILKLSERFPELEKYVKSVVSEKGG